uniref:YEATS domain-containing protein n=1 Tax=Chromera velia CCMP2878 TaxID=1169474 RepID=A0A0G4HEX3_9ALVE|eukprot:Cvel_26728.t1-p1 / transcript=Cvel_26728.t1 / gene=Cvel_26728 / organism=Chromera_velia_CCMP2878 / gene_product=Protein AF-9 homolog, putative / transcript_product=Protein AF-9 homolog, putative / location=Cvel_scaffold3225:15713-17544(+) / protein_length=346 / sequence_SO=supercontig / SO=protein_coding / is_pseudo=false
MCEPGHADTRKSGVYVTKPIIIGTYAFKIPQHEKARRHDDSTDHWTCLVRSPIHEDLSYFIKKVNFELHGSYPDNKRDSTSSPFQVEETGWGEFPIHVTLTFRDQSIDPVTISHDLRLLTNNLPTPQTPAPVGTTNGTCLVAETYETLVFTDPSEWFYDVLMAGPASPPQVPPNNHKLWQFFQSYHEYYDETKELQELSSLLQCSAFVQSEISRLRRELIAVEYETAKEDAKLGGGGAAAASSAAQAHPQQPHQPHQPHGGQPGAGGMVGDPLGVSGVHGSVPGRSGATVDRRGDRRTQHVQIHHQQPVMGGQGVSQARPPHGPQVMPGGVQGGPVHMPPGHGGHR